MRKWNQMKTIKPPETNVASIVDLTGEKEEQEEWTPVSIDSPIMNDEEEELSSSKRRKLE